MAPRTSIEIPMRGTTNEVVEVMLDGQPPDGQPPKASEIVLILKGEQAALNLWYEFAVAYYERGNTEAAFEILSEATQPDVVHKYQGSKHDRVKLLASLAAYYVNKAAHTRAAQQRTALLDQATVWFNEADKIDIDQPLTKLGKSVFLLLRGNFEVANYNFNEVLSRLPDNVPAMLGNAAIEFNRKEYHKALALYRRCLMLLEDPPVQVRLGIAMCFHQLGMLAQAERAYQRVVQLVRARSALGAAPGCALTPMLPCRMLPTSRR